MHLSRAALGEQEGFFLPFLIPSTEQGRAKDWMTLEGFYWLGEDLGCSDHKRFPRITSAFAQHCRTSLSLRLSARVGGSRAKSRHRLNARFLPVSEALQLQLGGITWEQRYLRSHSTVTDLCGPCSALPRAEAELGEEEAANGTHPGSCPSL